MNNKFSIFVNGIICCQKVVSRTHILANSLDGNTIWMCKSGERAFGTYGAVTRKRQKQREKFYEEKYRHNPNNVPKYSKVKKGSRGGWIYNPLKQVTKNNGSNFMYEQKVEEEVSTEERECIKRLMQMRKEVTKVGDIHSYCGGKNDEDRHQMIPSNVNLFSICDNFIDKKKEIINQIENPQFFVDTHIKKLTNEYTNINHLHEGFNENGYAKAPGYLKDVRKKRRNVSGGALWGNCKVVEDEVCEDRGGPTNRMEVPQEERAIVYPPERYTFGEACQKGESRRENPFPKEELATYSRIRQGKQSNLIEGGDTEAVKELEPRLENNMTHCGSDIIEEGVLQNPEDEQMLKTLYIEDILNYADEGEEIDISCLDVFTTLSTADRNRKLGSLFSNKGASFILYNNCIIASKFSEGTLQEYFHTRNACSLFDKSYQLIIRFTGRDSIYICNQFLSSDLNDVNINDVCYTCVLDNKAYIIDTGYVLKGENEVVLISSGYYKKGLYEFLSDYILFCRDSGMDVQIQVETNKRVLSLQGPLSNLVLNDVLDYFNCENATHEKRGVKFLKNVIKEDTEKCQNNGLYFQREGKEKDNFINIPYMSFKKLNMVKNAKQVINVREENPLHDEMNRYEILCIRCGDTGEDGFEFVVDNNISDYYVELFLSHVKVKLAGAYALNMLRMEAGIPLYGIDIFKNTTPITASLAWTLKYKKIKERNIFGYQNLLKEFSVKSKFLRIGIISKELIFKTCKILSYPYKEPIGYVTSCTWSPVYEERIAQGYIKREFAKNNEKVLISIPTDIPQEFSKKKKYKILRSRSAHKFALAQVCAFPFVEHKY
ncbi:aminomethyltransferase, putative [Plasmodium knowlesi strain H]|uniref:Aminomethyltransferase, putative n=3 Tax=Plasmodium knowlesi TaxID=5850 RepID=A0A5K1VSR3_PLAKH|nr:aminomethyltransferase, putative [Plasmodium knowlesi strain H]OTN66288.1 putative Aminomethyltransferase [Plasmodium knowlesi]CAA9989899.1 aminomethyltransferase, putative [Plasmodium knowlesi strain H]SBO24464.1 aminomethyltransferase, putative [Plasmodium knowlesi strain H]SBO26525.1 aminomethyltransferase, putative [Plasmodium knowlesi strain H]VVS79373.1 aminomethyltransferase, putative [Plasmodium knowlesi strain H]|eukprot:XP_002259915.1 Glycine cleavage T-protein (aminomethyl transferase), putative [Plasmodium knowlesi strain H]